MKAIFSFFRRMLTFLFFCLLDFSPKIKREKNRICIYIIFDLWKLRFYTSGMMYLIGFLIFTSGVDFYI